MCERTCPYCYSPDHFAGYGLAGSYIVCEGCDALLANRRDIEAAPTTMTEAEAEAWQAAGSGVLAGAEACDPADDEWFGPARWPNHLPIEHALRGL